MVLFSTYKSSRVMGTGALKGFVDKHRGIGEHFSGRPWAHGAFWIPGFSNMPVFIAYLVPWYFMQRFYQSYQWFQDETDACMMKRWGDDIETVRKNLSPADQVRARGWIFYEGKFSVFAPASMKFAPAGSDYPTGHKH